MAAGWPLPISMSRRPWGVASWEVSVCKKSLFFTGLVYVSDLVLAACTRVGLRLVVLESSLLETEAANQAMRPGVKQTSEVTTTGPETISARLHVDGYSEFLSCALSFPLCYYCICFYFILFYFFRVVEEERYLPGSRRVSQLDCLRKRLVSRKG